MTENEPQRPSWQKWTAIISCVAAVVTALAAAGIINANRSQAPGTSPNTTATAPPTQAAPPSNTARPTSASKPTVRWHGTVLITNNPADLDAVPVNNDDKSGGMDAYSGGTSDLEVLTPSLVWSGATDPTRSQCAAKLPTNGVTDKSYEPVSHGMRICMQTDTHRIALLKIVKDDGDGITTDITVWD